ncbi:MAG: hypothetical protein QM765_39145 [Myxococcales bacterium]
MNCRSFVWEATPTDAEMKEARANNFKFVSSAMRDALAHRPQDFEGLMGVLTRMEANRPKDRSQIPGERLRMQRESMLSHQIVYQVLRSPVDFDSFVERVFGDGIGLGALEQLAACEDLGSLSLGGHEVTQQHGRPSLRLWEPQPHQKSYASLYDPAEYLAFFDGRVDHVLNRYFVEPEPLAAQRSASARTALFAHPASLDGRTKPLLSSAAQTELFWELARKLPKFTVMARYRVGDVLDLEAEWARSAFSDTELGFIPWTFLDFCIYDRRGDLRAIFHLPRPANMSEADLKKDRLKRRACELAGFACRESLADLVGLD